RCPPAAPSARAGEGGGGGGRCGPAPGRPGGRLGPAGEDPPAGPARADPGPPAQRVAARLHLAARALLVQRGATDCRRLDQIAQGEGAFALEPRAPDREDPLRLEVGRVADPETLLRARIARHQVPDLVKRPARPRPPPRRVERLDPHWECAYPTWIRPVNRATGVLDLIPVPRRLCREKCPSISPTSCSSPLRRSCSFSARSSPAASCARTRRTAKS